MKTSIRKKIMPVLLALALIIGFFPILSVPAQAVVATGGQLRTTTLDFTTNGYKSETGVTETNSGIWENTAEGWSYNATTNTLTLSGVNIRSADSDSGNTYAIKLPDGAKIEMAAGTVNIIRAGDAAGYESYGIYSEGALTIQGSGTLNVTSGRASNSSYGIYSAGDMTIQDSVTVRATAGLADTNNSYGIYSAGSMLIKNSCNLTVIGGTATVDSSFGIFVATSGTITVQDSATVTATAGLAGGDSQGLRGTLQVIGGTLTATGGPAGADSFGIYGNNTISISDSVVTATGGASTTGISYGIRADSIIAINSGLIIAQSTDNDGGTAQAMNKAAFFGVGSMVGQLEPKLLAATAYTNADYYTAKFNVFGMSGPMGTYRPENIITMPIACTSYANDVEIIPGIANWTQDTKTLTITNLILNTTAAEAIKLPDGATLALAGRSVIRSGDLPSNSSQAVYGLGDLTIVDDVNYPGTGALIGIGGTAAGSTDCSYGIYSAKAVTISSGSVTAIGNSTNNESCGIWGGLAVNINGGKVTATGSAATTYSYGICSWNSTNTGTVTISDAAVTAVGGTAGQGSYGIYGTTATNISGGTITATGGTLLAAEDSRPYNTCGIYNSAGAIDIQNGSTVTATGGSAKNDHSNAIFATSSINITGSTVTAIGGTASKDSTYGIMGASIIINSGIVMATGGTAIEERSAGMAAASIIINSGTVTVTGGTANYSDSYAIYAYNSDGTATVSITGGTVTARGGTAAGTYTIGIYGKTSVTISGGTVKASGGKSTGTFSAGIFSAGSFAASGASTVITAESDTGAPVSGALAASNTNTNNIAFNNGLGIFNPAGGSVISYMGSYLTISSDGSSSAKYAVIKLVPLTAVAIKTLPTKVTYTAGDALDLSGLVVTLTPPGGSTQDVAFADFAANGLTTAPTNGAVLATTNTTVTITHTSNGTASQPITVNAAVGGGDSDSYTPSKTITVTETSSALFSGRKGTIKAEANMSNAFSNSVEVKVTDTDENALNFGLGAGNKVYPFDISLYIKGTNTKTEPKDGYAVKLSLPVPEELVDVKEQLSIMHKSDDGTVTKLNSALTQINGVWYLVFEASEFSPYALVVNDIDTYDETEGLPYYVAASGNDVFIGFAANGQYIAPEGVIVLIKQNPKSFSDIGSHWAKNYVDFVAEREIFNGTSNNTFSPDAGMTRAMFATVIGRLYERSYGEIEASGTHSFTDCKYDDYYGKYVDWAAEEGIIGGYGNGEFGPNDQISREQMAAILYRFADFLGALPADTGAALAYPDAGSISSWAQSAAKYCQQTSIITGRDGGSFVPQGTATRAEVAVILERFIESVLD
ncbi:MAG: S-layer homology domain-containing protein [Pseudoflavonifractor sp.]|nr:S-layer homology domain-containing protein [Pseudoflavonifractor sp.]